MPDSSSGGAVSPGPAGTSPVSASPAGGTPLAWAETVSGLVVDTVDKVKQKATLKVVILLRVIVYALVLLAGSITGLLLLVVGLVRMWDVYIPLQPLGRRVWLGYVVFGGALFLAGAWLLANSRRKAR